ncbi:MAG: rhamnulokinase, partial [Candidatus Omnitrophica bacterium]|nr:rhamnulokinase [Candidatus Omnitrophota bacterium]
FHYRDRRTEGMMEKAFEKVPRPEIFRETGNQFMPLNTLFQILATHQDYPEILNLARCLLFMPNLFSFWLCGEKVAEYTIASTSQMYNSQAAGQPGAPRGNWCFSLLERLGLPTHFLPPVVSSGTCLGNLLPEIQKELGLPVIPVYAVCAHDTASAVAAVPASGEESSWAYLSSGTWSLLGIEVPDPIINEKTYQYNCTNEGGFGGSIRLLKNIMGLWILQECRRNWERQNKLYSYEELINKAQEAKPFVSFINVDDPRFLYPGDMISRIREYCQNTGQPIPNTEGEVVRIILESLAMEYRYVLLQLEDIIERKIEVLHIVGGGSQNKLLSQFASSASKKTVIAGPIEATAAGNVLVQALARREIADLSQLREITRDSFPLSVFKPKDTGLWEEKYQIYCQLKRAGQQSG